MRSPLRRLTLAVSTFAFSLVPIACAPPDTAQTTMALTPVQIQKYIEERAVYGLPTDIETLQRLQLPGVDVGSAKLGIPLTEEEERALDLPGRMAFSNDLDEGLAPYVRSLPTYAGLWIDQLNGGGAVVMLTKVDAATQQAIESLTPARNLGVRIVQAEHTYESLKAAVERGWEAWEQTGARVRPSQVAVDVRGNRVEYRFTPADEVEGARYIGQVAAILGVTVGSDIVEPDYDTACTDRNHCSDPYKAGIRITGGSLNNNDLPCTLAFHIVVAGDVQALTAGHCGWYTSYWYHSAEGRVGITQATLYKAGGKDVMRISMYDVQASERVYGYTNNSYMAQAVLPKVGESVCASQGQSNELDCGTIADDWLSWVSSTAGYTVYGGNADGIDQIKGDSGSPLYRYVYSSSGYVTFTPIGVVDTAGALFARVVDALNAWGATIY